MFFKNALSSSKARMLVFIASIVLSPAAQSDEYDYFFEISCKPDLGYFSFHTIQIDESLCRSRPKQYKSCSKAVKAKHPDDRLKDPQSLLDKPYQCQLGDRVITLHITDRTVHWKEGLGGCPTRENYDVEIKVDGISKHSFHAYGQGPGQCDTPETHLVELLNDELRDCAIPEWSSSVPTCETQKLKSESGKGLDKESAKVMR